jgi:hypothetical protein
MLQVYALRGLERAAGDLRADVLEAKSCSKFRKFGYRPPLHPRHDLFEPARSERDDHANWRVFQVAEGVRCAFGDAVKPPGHVRKRSPVHRHH